MAIKWGVFRLLKLVGGEGGGGGLEGNTHGGKQTICVGTLIIPLSSLYYQQIHYYYNPISITTLQFS